jgi:hypothetical protein
VQAEENTMATRRWPRGDSVAVLAVDALQQLQILSNDAHVGSFQPIFERNESFAGDDIVVDLAAIFRVL